MTRKMAFYSLIFRRGIPTRTRLQALMNLFCMIYFYTLTLMVTHVSFFFIVPHCYHGDDWTILKHRLCIWYLFTAVVGNYVTCIFKETSVRRRSEVDISKNCEPDVVHEDNRVMKRKVRNRNEERRRKQERMCRRCNITVAERTHHCVLCEKCVLKRDHHCFFMGVCIGEANHLYFIFFTLFMGLGTFYGMILLAKYLYFLYGIKFYGPQTFVSLFVTTILSLLKGKIPPFHFLGLFLLLYISLAGTLASSGFLFWHVLIVARGQTTHEATKGIT